MSDDPSFGALARAPFPEQISAIERTIATGDAALAGRLLTALAALPDHEPLAHAVRALGHAEELDRPAISAALRLALTTIPDTGAQRVLRGLDRSELPPGALRPVADAVVHALESLPLARLGALCLMDRWLKNADRARRDALRDDAVAACVAALDAGAPNAISAIDDATLVRVPGARFAALSAHAAARGQDDPWRRRRERFTRDVLTLLRDAPRSLSQANAEELLSRRVYTDPGHFLVELLQNAEDAGATAFRVTIAEDGVTAWHDGAPFDARDVVGVLSIGQTTKSADQIGFFGVGFKSVYEICERPQVYSDLFQFEIADIAIPRPLAARPTSDDPDGGTLLVLPFRQPRDPAHTPANLLARALAVPPETLLTLQNLRRLDVHSGGVARRVARQDDAERHVVSLVVSGNADDDAPADTRRYAVATGRFAYDGPRRELSRAMTTRSLVAIALDGAGAPAPLPSDAPTIFSHLPTGERSGLRFVVHGHFDVPVERERLDLESPWNRWGLARAGELLAQAAEQLAATANPAALDGLLDVLPLPRELRHPAYEDLAAAARPRLAALALLPAAAGQRLVPARAWLVAPDTLALALSDAPLDGDGGRACAPLTGRRAEVALWLGARSFEPHHLTALLAATLGGTPDGAPYPAAWLAPAIGPVLDALGGALPAVDLDAIAALPLLPDEHGRGWPAAAIRRTTDALRALYQGRARPFLEPTLDQRPTLAQATLLRHLGVRHHDDAAFVADLDDPAIAAAVIAAAGPLAVHGHLASLGRALTADLARKALFPSLSGALHPVAPDLPGRAWLPPTGPLRSLVVALPAARSVPIVAPALADPLAAYLRDLGAEVLDLSALLVRLADATITLLPAELSALHQTLGALADTLSERERAALRAAALYPDQTGLARPLVGPRRVRVPADAAVEALAPDVPWLASELRRAPHLARLVPVRAGAAEVVAGLISEGADGDGGADGAPPIISLASLTGGPDPDAAAAARREALYAYLAGHGPDLSPTSVAALASAPVWAATDGALHPLEALRGDTADDDLRALMAALDPRPVIGDHALALARTLALAGALGQADLTELVALLGAGRGDHLAVGDVLGDPAATELHGALVRQLARATRNLRPEALAPLMNAALFRGADDVPRRPGRWSEPPMDAVYRAPDGLREALQGGARVLIAPADEVAFGAVLDALGVAPADALAFVAALESDGVLATAEACERARHALCGLRAALAEAPAAADVPARLTRLPLWPTRGGDTLAAPDVVRMADIVALVGPTWADDIARDAAALLDEDAEGQARALAPFMAFKRPVALIAEQVAALAQIGAPLSAQAPLLSDRDRLAALAHAVQDGAGDDAVAALPLWVDADARLTTGPLFALAEEALPLTRGLPLRARVAEPEWARAANDSEHPLAPPLPAARLIDALAAAARDTPEEPPPALADADGRAAFYRWLLRHAAELAADPQALGNLGNAPLLATEAGVWRAPRDLLLADDDDGVQLPDEVGLAAWRPAADLPTPLRRWLHQVVQLERGRRRQLMTVLVDAHRQAEADADVGRSAALLRTMATCWPEAEAVEDAVAFDWSVKNHKLRRLRVASDGGGWEQIGKLLCPTAPERELLAALLTEPVPATATAYDEPVIVGFLARVGALRALPVPQLEALMSRGEGLVPGLAATLALARYLALLATDAPGAVAQLDLGHAPWVPDRTGQRRAPARLYWPDDDTQALLGDQPTLLPHPEFALTASEALIERLPFRGADDARLADVLRTITGGAADSARGAPRTTLQWLDRALASGRVPAPGEDADAALSALREAFAAPRLRDDGGTLRPAARLVGVPAPELVGDFLTGWQDGLALPALAAALGVHERVGPSEVARYLEDVGARLDDQGGTALLAADPALARRLPLCLVRLARRQRHGQRRVPLLAAGPEGRATLTWSDHPTVALPRPEGLAAAARAEGLPLSLVVHPRAAAQDAVFGWLGGLGVPDLWALFTPTPAPARVEGDVTAAHAEAVTALGAALGRALGQPAIADALGVAEVSVRVAAGLRATGTLVGRAVSFEVSARYDAARGRLVVTPAALADHEAVALAIARGAEATSEAPDAWAAAIARGMDGLPIEAPTGLTRAVPEAPPAPVRAVAPVAPTRPASPGAQRPPSEAPPARSSWWARARRWFGERDEDADDAPSEARPEVPRSPREAAPDADRAGVERGPEPDEGQPFSAPDHSRWFQPRDGVESQLDSGGTFSIERAVRPDFGFAFSPPALPFPHNYAPQAIVGRFEAASQRWLPVADKAVQRLLAEAMSPVGPGAFEVAVTGRVPRGDSLFPTPLYGRLVDARATDGAAVRVIAGRGGRTFIAASRPCDVACRVVLDRAPGFETDADGVSFGEAAWRPLLAPTVPDSELPDEALGEAERLRVADLAALDKALAVRAFVQTRYAYDPTYLEDASVARWLRRVTRGRPNVHIAALHAGGGGGRHLGRGVCYELGVMACEMLRRVGIPAAIGQGWVWEGGQLAAPDHLWAMALLPTDHGLRWAPIDPATRDGQALRVSQRPPGDWEPPLAPKDQAAPPPPAWSADDEPRHWTPPEGGSGESEPPPRPEPRRMESGPGPASPRAAGGQRQRKTSDKRARRPPRPPVGELMRVVQHLAELSGDRLQGDVLYRRCRELLADPAKAAELLEVMGLDDDAS